MVNVMLGIQAASHGAIGRRRRFHGHDRAAAGLAQSRRVPGPGERAVRRVEIAILVLSGSGG